MSGDTTIGGDVGKIWQTEVRGGAPTHLNQIDPFTGTAGSPNSVINQVNPSTWLMGEHGLLSNEAGQSAWDQTKNMFDPPKNHPTAPPPPPKPGDANIFALQGQLSHEQRMASASTVLTGGGGLLDQPSTASRVLLGS